MKTVFILAPLVLMVGCSTVQKLPEVEIKVVEKIEYIVKVPPEELMTLPEMPASINVDEATQATVAQWIINSEQYSLTLREKLILIGKFLRGEQIKLDDLAAKENAAALNKAKPAE